MAIPTRRRGGFGEQGARFEAQAAAGKPRTAKLFKEGRSQAVHLPREFHFEGDEVHVRRDGKSVILTPVSELAKTPWQDFFDALDALDPTFGFDRDQPKNPQARRSLEESPPRKRKRAPKK